MATQQYVTAPRSGTSHTGDRASGAAARAGWAAKAALYAVTALLALQVATGDRGEQADQQGALHTVAEQPFGRFLLAALAVGLALYGLTRLGEAAGIVASPGETKTHQRVGYAVSGLIYLALSVMAASLALGNGGSTGGGGGEPSGFTAKIMELPAGRVLVALLGFAIAAAAVSFVVRGMKKDFMEELRTDEMSQGTRQWVERAGVAGLVARGVVFAIIGWFFVSAAASYDPNQAMGLDGALHELVSKPYGSLLLGLVAVGLLAYAVYSLAQARWRAV